jgi:hypothetical protein
MIDGVEIIDSNKINISLHNKENINDKLDFLIKHNIKILDIKTKNSDLETVFTNIMKNR